MAKPFPVTAQMVIKNEERFVWFAINSVLPYVKKFLITDTGSTDKTFKIIKSIKSKKIILTKNTKDSIVKIRQEQLRQTRSSWFLLVDGDEIWSKRELLKLIQLTKEISKEKIAVVNKTRNCVGDVWHYLPKEAGQYRFFNKKGHFNIRLMRALLYEITGNYPREEYRLSGKSINKMEKRLILSNAWYLHTTHLPRTSNKTKIGGRRKKIIEKGILMKKEELPEVFFQDYSKIITSPLIKRSRVYEIKAGFLTPVKKIKRR